MHAPDHQDSAHFAPDSRLAWVRLMLALAIGSIGSVGMWSVVVALPVVQAEFGATRGAVSLAFTLTMLGFGLGGVATGRITDRFGIVAAMALSIGFLGVAYVLAGLSTTLWQFIAVYFLIGLGTSATFAPLMAEVSHWFERYRGLAVTIVASGNYIAGTIWPPLITFGIQSVGWRTTHIATGIFCAATMTLLLLVLRAQIGGEKVRNHDDAPPPRIDLALSTNTLTSLLCIASIACCVAMAMPQVHIVAYCGDLGYGPVHGAEMLSLMMAFGIVSRIGSGYLADRIGGEKVRNHDDAPPPRIDLALSTNTLTSLLCIASIACCVAMAMPQVHIVAYCGDLGYGPVHGAEMLSLMMAFGIVSRIGSGYLADRIGGIPTLLIGSVAQGFALLFYLFFDSLSSLYIISAMFGLFQGGIVPSYAIIVRESMPAREAATRVGIVILASVVGMSFGGWVSGVIFDATGSYGAAFINGLAWNALNITIMVGLLLRARSRLALA